jgi:Antitoxin-like ribbon-helix-helix
MATKTKTKAQPSPRIPQLSPAPEQSPAPENVGDRKVLNFRLEAEVIYQLKLLALQERKPVQALLCEGVNEVFAKRGMERIAK